MNIFVTNDCPVESAKHLDDKRVVKMILETAQMLSTALRYYNVDVGYKSTHLNHPCNVWARQNQSNFIWLYQHGIALCKEYTLRYGKYHKSEQLIRGLLIYKNNLPEGKRTPFPNCAANKSLGINYKNMADVFKAYQLYLNDRWDKDKRQPTGYGRG